MTTMGKVALVGAGPGDEGLLTVRGLELIKKADCLIYDRLLNVRFLELTKENCEKIYVGKENHNHTMKQDDINELLYKKSKEYELVVRLKGGDPYVFGRGGEEALFLNTKGVEVEVVPGISSSVAAAALAGIPLTHRGLSKGFMVITAHNQKDAISEIDFSLLTDEDITLVFLMGLSHVGDIAKGLIDAGRRADTPAAVISCGTTTNQKKCVGTLDNILELVQKEKLISPSIIVVGKVVTLSDDLSYFEKRPLFGRKIFLPKIERFEYSLENKGGLQASNELEKGLTENGAEVFSIVSGKIVPTEIDLTFLNDVHEEDYIVFTSASGVNAFFYNLFEVGGMDARSLPGCKYAVIGEKTAQALSRFGIRADEVSIRSTAKDFARQLCGSAPSGATVYWMCAQKHSADFEKELSPEVNLKKIICYENVAGKAHISDEYRQKLYECDATIMTSGSSARFALRLTNRLPGTVFSIGPACSAVLSELGVTKVIEAKEASYEGLLDAIL